MLLSVGGQSTSLCAVRSRRLPASSLPTSRFLGLLHIHCTSQVLEAAPPSSHLAPTWRVSLLTWILRGLVPAGRPCSYSSINLDHIVWNHPTSSHHAALHFEIVPLVSGPLSQPNHAGFATTHSQPCHRDGHATPLLRSRP